MYRLDSDGAAHLNPLSGEWQGQGYRYATKQFDELLAQGQHEEIDEATAVRARLDFIAWYRQLADAGISPLTSEVPRPLLRPQVDPGVARQSSPTALPATTRLPPKADFEC